MAHECNRFVTRLMIVLCLICTSGCGSLFGKKSYIIPEESTPAEQFSVARIQEKRARGTLVREARKVEYQKAVAAYDAVISRFPSDQQYVPAAWIAKSELWYHLGSEDESYYPKSAEGFRAAADKYADQADIRAAALWGLGRTYDARAQRDS